MRRKLAIFAFPATVAWLCAANLIFVGRGGAYAPLGAILLILPGMVWTRAVHPTQLEGLRLLVAIAAVDLGLTGVTGLGLTLLPAGLDGTTWAVSLATVVTLGSGIAAWRSPSANRDPWFRHGLPGVSQWVAVAVGIAALVAAGLVSIETANHAGRETFTELSIVPSGAGHDPTDVHRATVLVTNHERQATTYRLVFTSAGTTTTRTLNLEAGDTFRTKEAVLGNAAVVRLYTGDSRTPYRSVWIGSPSGRR